jgi:hypothetical protein
MFKNSYDGWEIHPHYYTMFPRRANPSNILKINIYKVGNFNTKFNRKRENTTLIT